MSLINLITKPKTCPCRFEHPYANRKGKCSGRRIKRSFERDYFSAKTERVGRMLKELLTRVAFHVIHEPASIRSNVRAIFYDDKNGTVGSPFGTIVKNTPCAARMETEGNFYGRYTFTPGEKINQYVNITNIYLNITKWTYESENPCFCPNRFTPGMNWWEFELSGAAECITEESLLNWTELFSPPRHLTKSALRDLLVYNAREPQSFHLEVAVSFRNKFKFNDSPKLNSHSLTLI